MRQVFAVFPARLAVVNFLRARYTSVELQGTLRVLRDSGEASAGEHTPRLEAVFKQAEAITRLAIPLLATPKGKVMYGDMDRMAQALVSAAHQLQSKLDAASFADSHVTALLLVHRLAMPSSDTGTSTSRKDVGRTVAL